MVSQMKEYTNVKNTFLECVKSLMTAERTTSAWYEIDGVTAYMRLVPSVGGREPVIVIVNIKVNDSGKGIFTRFLTWLETLGHHVEVECVGNRRLEEFLIRQGYTNLPGQGLPCYRKEVQLC